MKPFSLTNVLRYRKQLEDTAAVQLGEAQRVLQKTREAFDRLDRQYHGLLHDLELQQQDGIDIERLQQYENHLGWLKNQRQQAYNDLEKAIDKVRQKRDTAVTRSRERQAMEKLKTRQDNAWKSYLEKKEAAQLDEIAVLSHDRKHQQEE